MGLFRFARNFSDLRGISDYEYDVERLERFFNKKTPDLIGRIEMKKINDIDGRVIPIYK